MHLECTQCTLTPPKAGNKSLHFGLQVPASSPGPATLDGPDAATLDACSEFSLTKQSARTVKSICPWLVRLKLAAKIFINKLRSGACQFILPAALDFLSPVTMLCEKSEKSAPCNWCPNHSNDETGRLATNLNNRRGAFELGGHRKPSNYQIGLPHIRLYQVSPSRGPWISGTVECTVHTTTWPLAWICGEHEYTSKAGKRSLHFGLQVSSAAVLCRPAQRGTNKYCSDKVARDLIGTMGSNMLSLRTRGQAP